MKIFTKPVIVTVIAIACIGLAVMYTGKQIQQNNNAPRPQASAVSAPDVSVIQASPNTYQAFIYGHGEAKAQWSLDLKAQVSGQITNIAPVFATGNLVGTETILANIDNTNYLQAIGTANAAVLEAKLAWQEEKDLGEQAKREWQRSGIETAPSSPLVYRSLQLESAQATLDMAKLDLATAKRDEKNTHISAPFNGLIVSRDIDLGSYVNAGDTVATLYSTDKIEISVPLSVNQWNQLNQDKSGQIMVQDVTHASQWSAYIDRFEQHIDEDTRQRNVVVAIDQPFEQETPLLPGTFLRVEMGGKSLQNVIQLPASALSQDGKVWYVNQDNILVSVTANKVFERGNFIYILPIDGLDSALILTRPLIGYLAGTRVNPIIEEQAL